MSSIKVLKPEDIDGLVPLAQQFFAEADLPMRLEETIWTSKWRAMLAQGLATVLAVYEGGEAIGAIGGVVGPDINDGEKVLTEAFWFVTEKSRGKGLRLLKAFEVHGKILGCKRITMVHLHCINMRLGEVYKRMGYDALETHYGKEL